MRKYFLKILTLLLLSIAVASLSGIYQTIGLTKATGDVGQACKDKQYHKNSRYMCWEASTTFGYPLPHRVWGGVSSGEYVTNWTNFSKNLIFYFLLIFSITSFYEKIRELKKTKRK